nr:PREDICTED: ataxin-1 isoform X1 [Tribolium castaneum]|eukprot:XP_015833107.1 PREDICTED: ataxin-1 isoform X1 [Tribolium castaneum]
MDKQFLSARWIVNKEGRRGNSVPMISAGLEGRLPYMTYPEPWRGPPKQPPEFLRPAPKPVPPTSRYNGVSTPPNGMRLAPSQHSLSKYPSPTSITTPVNLTHQKDEIVEELPYYRLYTAPPHLPHFPQFTTMYQNPYTPIIRSTFPTTSLPPLETYSPTTPTAITSSTFLSPPSTFSPPSPVKPGQSVLRDSRVPTQTTAQIQSNHQSVAFKVPSGKEGSLKHRILTRPEDGSRNLAPLDLQKPAEGQRKRFNATMSPPRSPKKPINNNNTVPSNFTKGSLIQLANGELRKIEDMRTEDFVSSAEHSPELRLAESTVVRIEENHATGTATITLSYNQRRTQVEVESTVEHPFFVFGQGWASYNPEKTHQCYGLKVHRLQVGDILISLTPREHFGGLPSTRSTTIMTTATSTAMTVRPLPLDSVPKMHHDKTDQTSNSQMHPINLHALSPEGRKRSALEQICDDDEQHSRRRVE